MTYYNHTQPGRWPYVLYALMIGLIIAICLIPNEQMVVAILSAIAALLAFCGLIFGSLTISDEGDHLTLHFGPLPVLFTTIRYADITSVEIGRTSIIDGWGMHYVPFRGRTYNVWGFDCVKLTLDRKIIRLGTDDAKELAKVIRKRMGGGISE
jgi:hypothetical protein